MRFLKKTIQRRCVFVVAEAIRLKVVFFLAYRGRHPQSVEAVLAGLLFHSPCIETFSAASDPLRVGPGARHWSESKREETTPALFTGVVTYMDDIHPRDSNPYRNDVHPCFFIIFHNYVNSINLFYGLNGNNFTWCSFGNDFPIFHRNNDVTVTDRLIDVV